MKKLLIINLVILLLSSLMLPVTAEAKKDRMSEEVPELLQQVYEHPEKYSYLVEYDNRQYLYKGQEEIPLPLEQWSDTLDADALHCDTVIDSFIITIFLKDQVDIDGFKVPVADIPYTIELNTPNGFDDIVGITENSQYFNNELVRSLYMTSEDEDIEKYTQPGSDYFRYDMPTSGMYCKYCVEKFEGSHDDRSWEDQAVTNQIVSLDYYFPGAEFVDVTCDKMYYEEYSDSELYELIKNKIINDDYYNKYIDPEDDNVIDPEDDNAIDPSVTSNIFENSDRFNIVENEDTILLNYHFEKDEEVPTVFNYNEYPVTKTSILEKVVDKSWVIKLLPVPGTYVAYEILCQNIKEIDISSLVPLTDRQNESLKEGDDYHKLLLSYYDEFINITPKVTYGEPIYFDNAEQVEDEQHIVIDKETYKDRNKEDRTDIISSIIVGFTGLLAIGIAGSTHSKNKNSNNEEDGASYQLVVDKNFGNRIRKGSNRNQVTAWIEMKSTDGETYLRNDLSYNISFEPGKYIQVSESYDVYGKVATILFVSENIPNNVDEDYISIIYTGKGGTFTERLHFKIVGNPYITFPEKIPSAMMMNVFAIGGDHATYKVAFTIEDAVEEPSKIRFSCEDPGVQIKIEHIEEFTYDVVIVNNTEEIKDRVFEIEKRCYVELTAVFEGDDVVNGFNFCLVPEGLSVKGKCKNGTLQLRSYENQGAGAMDPKIKPTEFRPVLALYELYNDGQKRTTFVDIDETEVVVGLLKEGNEISRSILEKYEYEIDTERRSVIDFIPHKHIPSFYPAQDWEKQSPEDYPVIMPLKVTYEGKSYTADIPCMLVGEKLRRMDVRKEEYLRVVSMITRYVPYEDQDLMFKKLNYMMKYRSVAELRVVEKKLLANAIDYYTQQSKDYLALEERLAWWQDKVEMIKMINDAAFSIVVARMTSDVAEIFITPAKDILFEAVGALSVEYFQGEPFDIDNLPIFDNVAKVGENLISKELDIYKGFTKDKNTWKKALAVVAGYMAYMALKNYLETVRKDQPDLIGSILKTFSDLTGTVVKGYILGSLKKYVTTDAFKNKMNSIFEKYIKETFAEQYLKNMLKTIVSNETYDDTSEKAKKFLEECYDNNGKFLESRFALWKASNSDYGFISGWDVLQKFLDETLGIGIASVQRNVGQSISTKNDHLTVKFLFSEDIIIDLDLSGFCSSINSSISTGANYVINLIFGDVPAEKDKKEYPKDIPVSMK